MSIIECSDLKKVYGSTNALDGLSFNIEENRITGLIGRNGAGKTTLLKLIAGFLRPTDGEIKVFSQNPFNSIAVSSNMIFVDDNMAYPSSLCLAEILKSAGAFYNGWDENLAMRLSDYFSLNIMQRFGSMSKGMKSTFNAIIGLASRCPLTIFDEPTTGMDSGVRKDFYRAMLKDYVEHPRTIIISSHLLNEIEDFLEDVLLIKEGEKCLHIPVVELKEYAIGLRGSEKEVNDCVSGKQVIFCESFAKGSVYTVIRNNIPESELKAIKSMGINISAVSADDLCVYLTGKDKGGIDDVFNKF